MSDKLPVDEGRMNSKHQSVLTQYKKTVAKDTGEDFKDINHDTPPSSENKNGPVTQSNLMTFTKLLEAMDMVANGMNAIASDPLNDNIGDGSSVSTADIDFDSLVEELNKLFTPVLVMQSMENEISDKANSEISEATALTERSMISFDDSARMAQLRAICALLIAKAKNTEKWQMFQKAANIKTQSKLDIQKEEYKDAELLAQKYLVKVSTTNNSSVARDAANELLPQTQH